MSIKSELQRLEDDPASPDDVLHYVWGYFQELDYGGDVRTHVMHDDRAAALILGSALERALEEALKKSLAADSTDEKKGLPKNFDGKIKTGYARGLYGEQMRDDLNWIRVIRNAFAHRSKPLEFANETVTAACDQIQVARNSKAPVVNRHPPKNAKEAYMMAVGALSEYLLLSEPSTAKQGGYHYYYPIQST